MKKILPLLLVLLFSSTTKAQSDNCSGAVPLTIGSCVTGNPGATQNLPGCSTANANDDVWYSFTATAGASYSISVKGSATYDAVFQVYSGTCSSLVSIAGCVDAYASGGTETALLSGLAAGTYYLRIYDYGSSTTPGTFTTCITLPPPPPGNNECVNARSLTVNASCVLTNTTSYAATQSTNVASNCNGGTPDDDVWFSFTANNYTQTIQVTPTGSMIMDPVIELFSGTCGALTQLQCEDVTYSGQAETMSAVGLNPGTVYYVRVYDWYSDGGYPFSICITGAPIVVGTQPNDEPCNAIQLPAVTADCDYLDFSTVGATQTSTLLAPVPNNCTNYNNASNTYGTPTSGGFGATTKDVWFKITVPASGVLYIMPRPNMGAGWIQDGVMALYRGATCSALTQYTCTDDHNYPAGYNDLQPFLEATGLTPGETVYLRYFGYGSSSGNFGLCVTAPTNDLCANALYICDLNGYSAMTSEAYDRDHPCNMRGNGEGPAPGYVYSVGANPAGPFGAGGAWGTGSPAQDVYIDNNSWVRFTAGASTASFRVKVYDCWGSGSNTLTTTVATPRGIQMQIFSATNCCSFTPVSDYKENAAGSFVGGVSTFTLNANSLVVGNDYYLMIDGWNNDICKYDIQALSGVALPDIVASPPNVCPGQSSLLTAPAGATSYTWEPGGANTRTIVVTPGSTETYTCFIGGVCGNKQMLTKTVYMNAVPNVQINSGSPISTCGTQTTVLTASGASTYTWNTSATTTSISVNPSTTTTYSVIGKSSVTGCTNTAVTTITVNPIPSFTLSSSPSNTICFNQTAVLSASGTATSYTWSPGGVANSITVTPASTTVYNVTGINTQGCTKVVSTTVTVNSLPTVNSSSTTICKGKSGSITASGTATSYTWSTGTAATGITVSPTVTTNYTVTGTSAQGCTNTAVGQVSVAPLPTVTVASGTICLNKTYTLTAGGANTYTWSTSQNGTSISVSPASTTVYTVTGTAANTCSNVNTATVTVNPLPTLATTPSISPSNCGAATGSITNVSVSGTPAFSYTWTNSANTNTYSTANITNQQAATYNLQVKDGNGCINNFGPYSITNPGAPAAPSASATANSICVGGTINLFANGSVGTYNWSGPNSFTTTTQNPTITNANTAMSGAYSVYMTASGCSGPATNVTITVNPLPTPNATSSQTAYCSGNTVNLFGSSASSYTWSGPGSFSSNVQNPSISNASTSTSGIYTLAVTNSNGCVNSTTVSFNVNANPTATANANPAAICAGQTINLTAGGGTSYSWSGPNGYTNGTQSPNITNAGTIYAGNYTVTVTNANACSSTAVASVSVNALPSYTYSSNGNNICYDGTIQLNAGSNPYTYTWSGPNSYTATGTSQTINNVTTANSGVYTVTASDAFCSQSQTLSINVYPQIVMNASANGNVVCTGNTINLLGTGGGSYAWNGPNGFSSNQQNPSITNATSVTAGIYTLTVTDAVTNCLQSDTVLITIASTPSVISTTNDSTCYGGSLTLNADFGTGVSVTWYSDAALTNTVQVNSNSYQPAINTDGTYVYYAQGTIGGCNSAVATVTAQYNNIHAAAIANVYNGSVPLSVSFTNTSTGVTPTDGFNWNFADGGSSTVMDPNYVFNNEGSYNVILTITDIESGCMDTATIIIKVEDELVIEVPNVFTPNGDGTNDTFHIKVKGAKSAEGYIYNRWGQLLYSWDVLNSAWDGKASNGEICPDATYFYIIKVIDKKDKSHTFPGYALIVR